MTIESMLKGHELFHSLGVEDVDRLSRVSTVKKFDKGEIIDRHNAKVSHVYFNRYVTVSEKLHAVL